MGSTECKCGSPCERSDSDRQRICPQLDGAAPGVKRNSHVQSEFTSPLVAGNHRQFPGTNRSDQGAFSSTPDDDLLRAARAGDFKKAVDAITDGANVYAQTLRGQNALMLAAASRSAGSKEMINFLLETRVELESVDVAGWTPLLHACRNGRMEAVELLLDHSASVTSAALDGKTAVILATLDAADDVVMKLLGIQAAINSKCDLGWSALFYGCQMGRRRLVSQLLKKRAHARSKARDGTTALMIAATSGDKVIGAFLLKRMVPLNSVNADGDTALMVSLKAAQNDFALWILNQSPDVSIKNRENRTAAEIAEYMGLHGTKFKIELACVKEAIGGHLEEAEKELE